MEKDVDMKAARPDLRYVKNVKGRLTGCQKGKIQVAWGDKRVRCLNYPVRLAYNRV